MTNEDVMRERYFVGWYYALGRMDERRKRGINATNAADEFVDYMRKLSDIEVVTETIYDLFEQWDAS